MFLDYYYTIEFPFADGMMIYNGRKETRSDNFDAIHH